MFLPAALLPPEKISDAIPQVEGWGVEGLAADLGSGSLLTVSSAGIFSLTMSMGVARERAPHEPPGLGASRRIQFYTRLRTSRNLAIFRC